MISNIRNDSINFRRIVAETPVKETYYRGIRAVFHRPHPKMEKWRRQINVNILNGGGCNTRMEYKSILVLLNLMMKQKFCMGKL
jgi:hypothetical protein